MVDPIGGLPRTTFTARTDPFRRQHAELMNMATELLNRLSVDELERDARGVRTMLARFAGKLRGHARMKNEALHPDLLTPTDEGVRFEVDKLLDEVGPLYAAFVRLEQRWPVADAITREPKQLILDVLGCFDLLGKRMSVENEKLYPLADSHGE